MGLTLIKKGYKINLKLVKKKMREVRQEFEIKRTFKNAQKINPRWDTEITQLTNKLIKFITVIKRLQKEFKYKNITSQNNNQ